MKESNRNHVLPINDLRPHKEEGEDCWCNPGIEYEGIVTIVIHNSMDGREQYENGGQLN